MIQLVFAHGHRLEFGLGDAFPWPKIPQDFKNFKERTKDTTLVIGAKTFSTLPGLLPGREHIVIVDSSRKNPHAKDGSLAHMYMDINHINRILDQFKYSKQMFSVIGGIDLLDKSLRYANKVIRTKINHQDTVLNKDTTFLHPDFNFMIDRNFLLNEVHTYIDGPNWIDEQIMTAKPESEQRWTLNC